LIRQHFVGQRFRKQMAKVGLKLGKDVGTMLVKKASAFTLAKELTRVPVQHTVHPP